MKVLITGGAGFIGSHLADRLLERDDEVLVIDNYSTARRDNLTPHSNLKIVEGTIADSGVVYIKAQTPSEDALYAVNVETQRLLWSQSLVISISEGD